MVSPTLGREGRRGHRLCGDRGWGLAGAGCARWEGSGHQALLAEVASPLGLVLQKAWLCHPAFSETPPAGLACVPHPRVRGERRLWLCKLVRGPGRGGLDVGTQPESAVAHAGEPAPQTGAGLCAAAALLCGRGPAALAHRSLPLCLSPCSVFSNMPPSAARCGHSCGSLLFIFLL